MNKVTELLSVQEVSRHHDGGAVKALDRVVFEACAGEVVALTGPSGCGKSTLLSLIGLLDQPTAGRVCITRRDLATVRHPSQFRAQHLGFIFQFHHMVPTMTLLENTAAPLVALGIPATERRKRAQDLLDQVNLLERAHFLPAYVSGGERQRAAVARALINRPPIILADEPTGNLDSHNSQIVIDLLMQHAHAQGALVLIATHNPDIARAADRQIELRDGRLIGQDLAPCRHPLSLK